MNNRFNYSLLGNQSVRQETNSSCNLIPLSNSSLPLAPRWENIPETLLLNGVIGTILFLIFLILTRIANVRSKSPDYQTNQSLINFLYGYRHPERWYVIPRFEFLRYRDRHHNHIMDYPYLYVPPKLPLANPDELFGSEATRSQEDSKGLKNIDKKGEINTKEIILKQPIVDGTKKVQLEIKSLSNSTSASSSNVPPSLSDLTTTKTHSENSPLGTSFFYPSILTAEQLQASYLSRRLNSFFSMFFKVTDADIIYAKGIDAYEYLLFQRHLILIMFVTNIFCLGVILPINWHSSGDGKDSNYTTSFQRTTMKNIDPNNSTYYWAHIISAVCIVIFSILVLNSYRRSTIARTDTQLARRTLLIGNIPVEQRSRVDLMKIFSEYFPKSKIEAIQFVYVTSTIEQYQLQLDAVLVAKEYCQYYKSKYKDELMVKQTDVNEGQYCSGYCRLCSYLYVCCCYWPKESKQPGTVFYEKEEENYRIKIKEACEKMVKEPSEYAFVTLKSYRQAKYVMEQLTRIKADTLNDSSILTSFNLKIGGTRTNRTKNSVDSLESLNNQQKTVKGTSPNSNESVVHSSSAPNDPLDPKNNPHVRSIRSPIVKKVPSSDDKNKVEAQKGSAKKVNGKEQQVSLNGPLAWSIRYAPHPDNVDFVDILNLATTSKYTLILLHGLMVIIFIFFTTPNVLLSMIERINILRPDKNADNTGYRGMLINYISILLQIITTALLPGLITIISKQIPYEDTASKNHAMMWKMYAFLVLMVIIMPSVGMNSAQALIRSEINFKCLFPTDNGSYYVNYVISSIFLTTILELIKPIDILFYTFILWTSRSSADFEGGRQYIQREFSVGMQHTSVLLIFSTVMTYSISCPLIAPVGLLYLIVKHSVDHYHLFYTYFTKKVDESLQDTITLFVKLSLLLMLFQTSIAISVDTGVSYFSLISQIVFWISLAIFVFNCFFDCTSRAMMTTKRNRFQREFCACFYTPRVIGDLLRSNAIPESCISRQV